MSLAIIPRPSISLYREGEEKKGLTEAINNPNMAPNPPPITPAIAVLPKQLSMPICIALTICCSCSDMPALGFMAAGRPPGKAILFPREKKVRE